MPRLGAFTFEEGGRTFECIPEVRGDPSRGPWWWFTVSNDPHRRILRPSGVGPRCEFRKFCPPFFRKFWHQGSPQLT